MLMKFFKALDELVIGTLGFNLVLLFNFYASVFIFIYIIMGYKTLLYIGCGFIIINFIISLAKYVLFIVEDWHDKK